MDRQWGNILGKRVSNFTFLLCEIDLRVCLLLMFMFVAEMMMFYSTLSTVYMGLCIIGFLANFIFYFNKVFVRSLSWARSVRPLGFLFMSFFFPSWHVNSGHCFCFFLYLINHLVQILDTISQSPYEWCIILFFIYNIWYCGRVYFTWKYIF